MPLLYRPKDTRLQNIMVTIPEPSPEGRPNQQELVLNDVVEVPLKYAREVLGGMWGSDWALGYAITVHSGQGLTIADPQNVWIIDDYLSGQILPTWPYQEWSISASSSGWCAPPPSPPPPPPRRSFPVRHAASLPRSRRSSSAKSSRGSWRPTSVMTRLKGYDLTSRSIISLDS